MATVLVQEIITKWTKLSRGAPNAAKRAAVPRSLLLPLPHFGPSTKRYSFFEHGVIYKERADFQAEVKPIIYSEIFEKKTYASIEISLQDKNELQVFWSYDWRIVGAPRRPIGSKFAFSLRLDEWGRVLYNGRFAVEDTWLYKQTVFNVALVSSHRPEIFVSGDPIKQYDQIASLS